MPAVVWGYFPVNADGDELIVWSDDDRRDERVRFTFPRQQQGPPPLASPTSSARSTVGEADYAAFHVVTIGQQATDHERELFAEDRYQDYLLAHGLSIETTEALMELWHRRIREEWGFVNEDGPTLAGPVPPAVPGLAVLVGLPRLPRPRRPGEARRPARPRSASA